MSLIAPVFSFGLNGYTGSGLALQDKAEKSLMRITIGIDISKETLDAYRFPDNQHIQVANGRAGHKTLVRWIGKQNGSLVVFEATGAYHRNLEAALAANGTAFAKVNPRQARRFAEATGRLAKTDRVDAVMLAKMGAILSLTAHEPKTEALHILRELITARRALMKDKVAAKTRLQTTRQTLLKNQINARLNQIKIQIRQVDAAIAEKVTQDEALSNKLAILISIPGIAETTAFSMLIEMPELGRSKESRLQVSPASHRCRGSRVNGKARNVSRADEHFYGGPSTCPLWSQRDTIPVSRQNTISSFAQENLGKSPLQRS